MLKTKYFVAGATVVLLAIGVIFVYRSPVRAEDAYGGNQLLNLNTNTNLDSYSPEDQSIKSEEEHLQQEDDKNDGEVEVEDGLDTHLNEVNLSDTATVQEFSASDLHTYSDVVKALQSYSAALDKIITQGSVSSTVTGLNDKEMALLNAIFSKDKWYFNQSTNRAKEIKVQIQALNDVLQPLGDSPISPLLQKFIVTALNDFKDEINNLGNLEHFNYDVLGAELSN